MQKLSKYMKLKRELFIFKNIDVCLKSSVKDKEIAVKNSQLSILITLFMKCVELLI